MFNPWFFISIYATEGLWDFFFFFFFLGGGGERDWGLFCLFVFVVIFSVVVVVVGVASSVSS